MLDQVDDNETPDDEKWKVEAQKFQQEMFLLLGDREWDECHKSDEDILRCKIRFGLYFQAEKNTEECEENETVRLLVDTILKNAEGGNKIHFACIFIFGERKDELFYVPVFKVKGKQNEILFIDSECHVYENWQNYLSYNHLPECLYCCPRDGLYQANENKVLVDFRQSPSCDPKLKVLYNSASILKIMGSLLIDNSIQAPPQLFSGISSAADCTTQSAEGQLSHGHCLDPNVSKAGVDCLRNMSTDLKVVQSLMHENITLAATAGEVATEEEEIAYNAATYSSRNLMRLRLATDESAAAKSADPSVACLTLSSIVTLRYISVLIEKKNKGTLTDVDILNFETSVLFFTNNVLPENMARKVIEDTQKQVLNEHCANLAPSQIQQLFKLLEFSKGKTQLHRNANNIKAINRILDEQAFYESLVTIEGDLEGHQIGFSSEEPGVININNELHIAPSKFVEISATDRLEILDATKKFQANGIDDGYRSKIEKILKKNRVVMQWQRDEAIEQLKQAFNTENLDTIKIDGKEIFRNMTPSELDRLSVAISNVRQNRSKILEITNKFATMRKCKNPRDYINYVEIVDQYIKNLKRVESENYDEALKDAEMKRDITEPTFLREMGVKVKKNVFFFNQVFDKFFTNLEESFKALEEKYLDLEKKVLPINAKMFPNFASDASAVCHYFKHSVFNNRTLTEDEYFALASELVNEPLNRRSAQLNQQGDRIMISYTNPNIGAFGVVFENSVDGTLSLVTVYYKKVLNQ